MPARDARVIDLRPREAYLAFSTTAGLLLLWHMAGYLRGANHSKLDDYIIYAIFFGAGPILVWIAWEIVPLPVEIVEAGAEG